MAELPADTFRIPYALRRVPRECMASLLPLSRAQRAGDIVLAQLESIGRNARLELATGRASTLHTGDHMAVVFGNRYATMQFEGYAQAEGDACDLLSMGGVCGRVESKHEKVLDPSRLRLLGAIGDAQRRALRLQDFALPPVALRAGLRKVVVCGSAMDVGKTHTAMSLIVGLRRLGCGVASIKLTGTATGRDTWAMQDAGAHPALDFVDGGHPSTYLCSLAELLELDELLTAHAGATGADWVVIEIADGLLQKETAALLGSRVFTDQVLAWVFACGDPLAALGGVSVLRSNGVEPLALTGLMTMSPLAMNEASSRLGIACFSATELQGGALNESLLRSTRARPAAS